MIITPNGGKTEPYEDEILRNDLEKRMAELEAIERRASEEARYDLNMEMQELKDRIELSFEDESI